eukprot:1933866-Pyramimonas_sp.AAC.1
MEAPASRPPAAPRPRYFEDDDLRAGSNVKVLLDSTPCVCIGVRGVVVGSSPPPLQTFVVGDVHHRPSGPTNCNFQHA